MPSARRQSAWIQTGVVSSVPARARLFCLPHAGGSASAFHGWNLAMPAGVETCCVQLPGRGTRFSERAYTSFDPLAEALLRELSPWTDLPYAVFGHSMGALLAFEWVRRMRRAGLPMPLWVFLSGRRAPHIDTGERPMHALPDDAFLEALMLRYRGIPPELVQDAEALKIFLPVLRADIAVVESYRYEESEQLGCPITVSGGIDDDSVTYRQLLAWQRHTRAGFTARMFPGGHFYPREALLKAIASTLAQLPEPGPTPGRLPSLDEPGVEPGAESGLSD